MLKDHSGDPLPGRPGSSQAGESGGGQRHGPAAPRGERGLMGPADVPRQAVSLGFPDPFGRDLVGSVVVVIPHVRRGDPRR